VQQEEILFMNATALAINGGSPVRTLPWPPRAQFGSEELAMVTQVFEESRQCGWDFGYQGRFETEYAAAFCRFQGGGLADAVSSGTAALLTALAALDLPARSRIIFSPVTDPGGVTPALFLGHAITVADAEPGSYNLSAEALAATAERTGDASAVVVTHLAGIPADMDAILPVARRYGLKVVEDCSQAHGARHRGRPVGVFGDVAVFSTMFSKAHSTGGCGGLVYTMDPDVHWRGRAFADRGKPSQAKAGYNPKDPRTYTGMGLNFNQDELSCAIGLATLAKLPDTIEKRLRVVEAINAGLEGLKSVRPIPYPAHCRSSPFFLTVAVDLARLRAPKADFARAVAAEGAWVNPDYGFVVAEWPWIKPYLPPGVSTPQASAFRETTFNLLFNERFGPAETDAVVACVRKVAAHLADER
jgi:dTDP-4-amino-4,6-dideoxygalactose transaminase